MEAHDMAHISETEALLAQRVWRLIFEFFIGTSADRTRSLGKRGLTPNDSRALNSLSSTEGRSMRALADEWECDASNATWIVDRLERFGLARRQAAPHDRRLKLVVLTAKGLKTKADLMAEFYSPPAELAELDRSTLQELERALKKLPPRAVRSSGTQKGKSNSATRQASRGD
jgi:DNA-binding MarR family transcriptional regulator